MFIIFEELSATLFFLGYPMVVGTIAISIRDFPALLAGGVLCPACATGSASDGQTVFSRQEVGERGEWGDWLWVKALEG